MEDANEVSGTIQDAIRELLKSDPRAAREFLKESFLTEAALALFHARKEADLSQAELASRLGTKQPAIARLEADFNGSLTLRRFVEVALACDVAPLDIRLVPLEELVKFVTEEPEADRTAHNYYAWSAAQVPMKPVLIVPPGNMVGPSNVPGTSESVHNAGSVPGSDATVESVIGGRVA
jgi:transcriptional regulator with XRE-family HTH domain